MSPSSLPPALKPPSLELGQPRGFVPRRHLPPTLRLSFPSKQPPGLPRGRSRPRWGSAGPSQAGNRAEPRGPLSKRKALTCKAELRTSCRAPASPDPAHSFRVRPAVAEHCRGAPAPGDLRRRPCGPLPARSAKFVPTPRQLRKKSPGSGGSAAKPSGAAADFRAQPPPPAPGAQTAGAGHWQVHAAPPGPPGSRRFPGARIPEICQAAPGPPSPPPSPPAPRAN